MKKEFSLETILSVMSGYKLPETTICDVYNLIKFVVHKDVEFSHDDYFYEAVSECKKRLLEQHPKLERIIGVTSDEIMQDGWFEDQLNTFGRSLEITSDSE